MATTRLLHPATAKRVAIRSQSTTSTSYVTLNNPTATLLRNNSSPRSGAFGSSLGSDSSMIAANNRCIHTTSPSLSDSSFVKPNNDNATTDLWNRQLLLAGKSDSSMIAANHRNFSSSSSSGAMQDEYGDMTSDGYTYVHPTPFKLESGLELPEAQLRYQTYGELNEARDNVIVICHALTGNASLDAWWGDLLGPGKAFDTDKYLVVCANILGSCYGSTSPTSINPQTNEPYGKSFPDISVQDTVRLQLHMLVDELKVNSIKSVIGGSFGGMQALEFAVQAGSTMDSPFAKDSFFSATDDNAPLVRTVIPIACGASHTAWQIAISETQRQAIYADPNWETNGLEATQGLSVARQIGMVSYRTAQGYSQKFGRDLQSSNEAGLPYGSAAHWKVKSYLEYQGEKFLGRFDPITYVKMTEQMDSHDVARGRGSSVAEILGFVQIPALVLGIDSDVLYPLPEQEELAKFLPNSEMHIIHSDDGHDGFLLEQEQVSNHVTTFLDKHD